MDFRLTEEQEQVKQMVRDFAAREIRPHVLEWDEAQHFPLETIKQLGALGMLGAIFPEAYGGAGLSYVDYVNIIEELAAVESGVALAVAAHNSLCSGHIYLGGSEAQRTHYLPKLTSGEWIGCWALTEPASGSDAAGLRCSAVQDGESWVLNGTKNFITNTTYAQVAVVLAVTDKHDKKHGITAFVIEMDQPGIRPGKKENKLGMRTSDTAELVLENCRVPAENVLGRVGYGFIDAMKVLDGGRISIGALAVGIARGAYEAARDYAKERTAFGKPIGSFQNSRFVLAEIATEVEIGQVPGDSVHARRYGDRDRSGTPALLSRRCAEGCRREDDALVVDGEAVCVGDGGSRDPEERADLRRLWLHQGVPGREVLPRRDALHHRRGHQRDSADGDRARAARDVAAAAA